VIDDDARNVFAITSTLELHGMTVTQAADGRKGIEALLSAEDTDLILMDVMMPELDGYTTMNKIRQMPAFATLPIIAVTARAMPGDREKSIAAGASDYVTKPVDTDELLSCMGRWLSRRLRPSDDGAGWSGGDPAPGGGGRAPLAATVPLPVFGGGTAPDAVDLIVAECELQALTAHGAPGADLLGPLDLSFRRADRGDREEQIGLRGPAGTRRPPVRSAPSRTHRMSSHGS
jgi:CheY-like chemotaxis protein